MKKAFFDVGPGVLNSEAWQKGKWDGYEIIGFEPDPMRYEKLKNLFPGKLLNLAISDKNERISGILHDSSGFIMGGYPGYTKQFYVNAVTLDVIDQEYGPFDEIVIWADIEGSELRMLNGAENVLKKTTEITVELHTGPRTTAWAKSYDVFKFLTDRGFIPDREEKPQTPHDSCYDVTFTKQK